MRLARQRLRLDLALAVMAVGVAVAIAACGDDEEPAATTSVAEGECAEVETPAPKEVNFDRPGRVLDRGERATAVVATSCGSFEIRLDTERSPRTANSFAYLAEQGLYDDTAVHLVAPGLIQGGDPTGDGTGGPGYFVDEPPPARTEYLRGTVAMAKTAIEPPGRSGSQFFIVSSADAGLPPQYAVLGGVSEGIETVERIGELDDPATDKPLMPVVISSVKIESR